MGLIKKKFAVEGMHCGTCAVSVGMILKNLKGVVSARAEFESKTAEVEYDSDQVGLTEMSSAVEGLGYRLKED
jgi:copper chaperone CopZ